MGFPEVGVEGSSLLLGQDAPEIKRIILNSRVYRNAIYFVGKVGSIN